MTVIEKPMNVLLQSLCAQLRGPIIKSQLNEQAAGAIESLWRDNVRLSKFVLETEAEAKRCINESAEISRYGALRDV